VDRRALGYLTGGERRIRANEIVAGSGSAEGKAFVESTSATFKQQAEIFLNHSINRKRRPAKPTTIQGWRYCLNNWLNPTIGELPLASVNNMALKGLVRSSIRRTSHHRPS